MRPFPSSWRTPRTTSTASPARCELPPPPPPPGGSAGSAGSDPASLPGACLPGFLASAWRWQSHFPRPDAGRLPRVVGSRCWAAPAPLAAGRPSGFWQRAHHELGGSLAGCPCTVRCAVRRCWTLPGAHSCPIDALAAARLRSCVPQSALEPLWRRTLANVATVAGPAPNSPVATWLQEWPAVLSCQWRTRGSSRGWGQLLGLGTGKESSTCRILDPTAFWSRPCRPALPILPEVLERLLRAGIKERRHAACDPAE